MALSANSVIERAVGEFAAYQVLANKRIYRGAFVGLTPSGYAKPFEPGDEFAGVAEHEFNGGASDGAVSIVGTETVAGLTHVRVLSQGDIVFTLASVAITDIGAPVFATADNTLALTGHPDAFVGFVIERQKANTAQIRLRRPGERPPNGVGSYELDTAFAGGFEPLGAASGTKYHQSGLIMKSILGTGLLALDGEDGGATGDFDAVSEVALNSIRSLNATWPVDKGITFECEFRVSAIGDDAALDVDWGMGTALTTNSEADIDHADMAQLACYHLDGNVANILLQSDDATADVAAVDSGVDNSLTVNKKFKIVIRLDGTVEFWIAGVRYLPSTTFAVLSTVQLAPFVNKEKTANDTLGSFILARLRVAGGMAA